MKVVYNSKEIMNTTNDYNGLLNRPMINSHTLEGVVTLSDINAYTKEQIDELIGNSRSIEIVTALPTNLIENTLYYVGPDANDFYDVYLVDEVRNVFNIGTSQFGEYFAGTGIDIDADNYITAKIDNKTITVDSENNLHAVLDLDTIPVVTGATSSSAGVKGLVPQPAIGDNASVLLGSGQWKKLMDIIYPRYSIYITLNNTNPGTFLPGTTWAMLEPGKAIWTTDYSAGAWYLSSVAPNISYSRSLYYYYNDGTDQTGSPFYISYQSNNQLAPNSGTSSWCSYDKVSFDASRCSSVYKDGQTTVQPDAIKVCVWWRTA